MAGVERWGRTTPRRGAKGEGPCRSRRIFEIAGTPRGRARRECFTVFHALPHPPPTFVLAPLPLGWGWGHSLHLSCRLPGKVCARPCPAARRLGAGERARRGGGALRAQRWGAAHRALPASPAWKSRRRPRLSRFSRDLEGRQGRLQLQIYVIFIVYSYFTM